MHTLGWTPKRCYWQKDGAGCKECGAKVVRGSIYVICTRFGLSTAE